MRFDKTDFLRILATILIGLLVPVSGTILLLMDHQPLTAVEIIVLTLAYIVFLTITIYGIVSYINFFYKRK